MTFQKTLSKALLAGMLCLAALPVLAQEDQPPAIPATPDAAAIERGQLDLEAYQEALESRSVYDFRIAYLVAPDALPTDHIASEQMVAELTGAEVFRDWEAFAAENEVEAFQVLLIHESMYEQVDVTVTQAAYRNRIIIFAMGMTFDHLVEVTGDRCMEEPNPQLRDESYEMITGFRYVPNVPAELTLPMVEAAYLENCNPRTLEQKTASPFNILKGTIQFSTDDVVEYPEMLTDAIVSASVDYGIEPIPTSQDE